MPSRSDHQTKAQHNETFKKSISEGFSDWEITTLFYAALHHIRAYLSSVDKKWTPLNLDYHTIGQELERLARADPSRFGVIATGFAVLKNYSQEARYQCLLERHYLDRLTESEVHLRRIREALQKLTG
jgi:hypothetical protein